MSTIRVVATDDKQLKVLELAKKSKEFKLVGISAKDKFPESFPETADKVLTDFGGVLNQIQNAKSYDTVFCPTIGLCL